MRLLRFRLNASILETNEMKESERNFQLQLALIQIRMNILSVFFFQREKKSNLISKSCIQRRNFYFYEKSCFRFSFAYEIQFLVLYNSNRRKCNVIWSMNYWHYCMSFSHNDSFIYNLHDNMSPIE